MAETLTYEQARTRIKSGDIINVYRPKKFQITKPLYAVINFFTGSPIFHNVVAIWMTSPSGAERLMCVESKLFNGKRIVPMSVYSGFELEVMPLPEVYKFENMEENLMERLNTQGYGYGDFFMIGLAQFLHLPERKKFAGQVCSELAAGAWVAAGVPITNTEIGPGELKNVLLHLGVAPSIITTPTIPQAPVEPMPPILSDQAQPPVLAGSVVPSPSPSQPDPANVPAADSAVPVVRPPEPLPAPASGTSTEAAEQPH